MTAALPAERVADILTSAGYRRIPPPLRVAGLDFNVAGAFLGVGRSADLVVIGDTAADGERKVLQQIEGVARALDVMRSHRPLTVVIVGPRPVGKTLEALAQVGRILMVEEALDAIDLKDRLAVLLPLALPDSLNADRDLGTGEALTLPDDPLGAELVEGSKFGEEEVRTRFHVALKSILDPQSYQDDEGP